MPLPYPLFLLSCIHTGSFTHIGSGYGSSVDKVVKAVTGGFIVGVGDSLCWCVDIFVWYGVYVGDIITYVIYYEYKLGSSGVSFDSLNG